jgi:uncharacterized LabA/DUF88 family protein
MFSPKSAEAASIYQHDPHAIDSLLNSCSGKMHAYIDWANIDKLQSVIGFKIKHKRLIEFLESISGFNKAYFYAGYMQNDPFKEYILKTIPSYGFTLKTKLVKEIRKYLTHSDVHSIAALKSFVRPALLRHFTLGEIVYTNSILKRISQNIGANYILDRKCNFDVEMGTDMSIDGLIHGVETFLVFSGDSDFADTITTLIKQGKRVIVISTSRHIASELGSTGAFIFDIRKLKNFICQKTKMDGECVAFLEKQKGLENQPPKQ